jgi:hypothetical protein
MDNPRREDTLNRVFLMGYRFDLLLHISDRNAPFAQYLRRLVALRQEVKADLYVSDFRDEIGLGPLPEKVYAKLFRRGDGQSLTVSLIDRRAGKKSPFELTIDLSKHEFPQPGPALLHEFDSRHTQLTAHTNQGKLVLQVPTLTGEVAVIVVRRRPDVGSKKPLERNLFTLLPCGKPDYLPAQSWDSHSQRDTGQYDQFHDTLLPVHRC